MIRPTFIQTAIAAAAALSLGACQTVGAAHDHKLGAAIITQANGLPAGTATLIAHGDKVNLSVAAIGLPPGTHGLHLHMTGKCEGPAFASAGLHLNPASHQHGSANPLGSHLGDLPNLVVDNSGVAALPVELPGTAADLAAQLFDTDGSAVVIHANADDLRTDPSGNSGPRIACGVLVKSGS